MKRLRTVAIILAIAAVAAAVVLAALVASSQPEPIERAELISVGNITMTQVEGRAAICSRLENRSTCGRNLYML